MAINTGTTTAPKKSTPTYHGNTAGKTALPQTHKKPKHASDQSGAGNTPKPSKG